MQCPVDHPGVGGHWLLTKALAQGGLSLRESYFPANVELPAHGHLHAGFHLVLEGAYSERVPGVGKREYDALTVVYHPPGHVHSTQAAPNGALCLTLELTSSWLSSQGLDASPSQETVRFTSREVSRLAMTLHRELANPDDLSPMVLDAIGVQLIASCIRERRSTDRCAPEWLRRTREHLREQFASSFDLRALAAEAGVHPVHLARCFREVYGCTAGDYVRLVRVQEACTKLVHSAEPLGEIAVALGFSDLSHFTRVFKEHTGLAPGAYRQMMRKR
jgi:AraC family transcriptional regulator